MLRNFTIITAGGCNAKCDFCPDPMNYKEADNYLHNLKQSIAVLPDGFHQVSISGGEPTISPYLKDILQIVRDEQRFTKVVLTTNGTKLEENLNEILTTVDHINISRHAVGYENNVAIFKNKQIISDDAIARVVEKASKRLVDVTLNYVYTEGTMPSLQEAFAFIGYAKSLGCKVSFRYDQRANSLTRTTLENELAADGYVLADAGSCPVCRTLFTRVFGVECTFKSAFQEPGKGYGSQEDPYELIYHVSGKLCLDWDQKTEYLVSLGNLMLPFSKWSLVKDDIVTRKDLSLEMVRAKFQEELKINKDKFDKGELFPKRQYVPSGCGSSGCG